MRTEHCLFHVLGNSSESRVKFVGCKGISLSPLMACCWPFWGGDFDVILTLFLE